MLTIPVLLLFTLPVVLSVISVIWLTPEWADEVFFRQTDPGKRPRRKRGASWSITNLIAALFSIVVSVGVVLCTDSVDERHFVIAALAWLTPIVTITDYTVYKIPRGVSRLTHWLTVIVLAVYVVRYSIPTGDFSALIVVGMTMTLPVLLMFSRGIGFGDIRLLFTFSMGTPWWLGITGWAHSLILTTIIGAITFVFARLSGKGKLVEYEKGKLLRPLARLFGKDIPTRTVESRAVPFGPALMYGFLGYAILYLVAHDNAASFPSNSIFL